MGKKKPFIDRKNSSTYHLLYRSQRDVGGDDLTGTGGDGDVAIGGAGGGGSGGVILWPSPGNNKETDRKVLTGESSKADGRDPALSTWEAQLKGAGLVDDYDYEKHMKPITGTGDYFDALSGRKGAGADAGTAARSRPIEEETIKEVDRQLESIALTADCMDEDIARALFEDFDEGEYEELNDDFVLDAATAPPPGEGQGDDGGFDFASHVQRLMEKARFEADGGGAAGLETIHEQGRRDKDFFAGARVLGEGDDDDSGYFDENEGWEVEGTPGVVPKLSEAEERALCDKFAATLAEYDSDEIGEGLDDDDDEYAGALQLEGDEKVEAALDDFLLEKRDEIFMQGARHYMEGNERGGNGFSALVGTRMVPAKQLDSVDPPNAAGKRREDIQPIEAVLGEADETLGTPLAAPPAEEIFIDGKSYYSEKIRNPWDCESILTTYSNLDNNPTSIGAGEATRRRRRKQSKKKGIEIPISEEPEQDESVTRIRLSDKTGLPLGVLPGRTGGEDDEFDTFVSVNKGEARKKKETPEEKRARKAGIKRERQLARMQKKMMKEAFSEEFSKRTQEVLADDVGGKSVFRF